MLKWFRSFEWRFLWKFMYYLKATNNQPHVVLLLFRSLFLLAFADFRHFVRHVFAFAYKLQCRYSCFILGNFMVLKFCCICFYVVINCLIEFLAIFIWAFLWSCKHMLAYKLQCRYSHYCFYLWLQYNADILIYEHGIKLAYQKLCVRQRGEENFH